MAASTGLPDSKTWKSLGALAAIRAQSVFHEKVFQYVLIGLALVLAATGPQPAFLHLDLLVFALVPLPVLLAAPFQSARVALRIPPKLILLSGTWLQPLLLFAASAALRQHHLGTAALCFFLFACQAAALHAANSLLFQDLAPPPGQGRLQGGVRLLVLAAIVLGTFLTGEAFRLSSQHHDAWTAAIQILQILAALSLLSLAFGAAVRPAPAHARPSPLPRLTHPLRHLFLDRDLRLAGMGLAFFWFASTATAAILLLSARELLGPGSAALSLATRLTSVAGIGVMLGSLSVSCYCRRGQELDLIPAAALGLAFSFAGAVFAPAGSPGSLAAMLFLGLSGGLFFVSLHDFLRQKSGPAYETSVLPAVQLLSAAAQVLALLLAAALRSSGLPSTLHFAILGLLSAGAVTFIGRILPRHFLRFFFILLIRLVYRIKPLHREHVPKEGGVLMISNHVSYIDAFLLSVASPRPVRFVIVDHFLRIPAFGWFLRLFDVIPISPSRAKDAIRTTADAIRQGDLVCIFPEGQLTRTGMLNELKKGFELIVRQAQCPVVPVYLDSVWGSIFSFERFRYFSKLPRRFPYPVTVNFGVPVSPEAITSTSARILIQDLSVDAFAARDSLRTTLGAAALRGLRQHGGRPLCTVLGQNVRQLTRRDTLSTSLAIARLWRSRLPARHRRVGILLPPGSMPAILHLAAVFAGRVPVHLPLSFLTDVSTRDRFLEQHGIHTVFSSRTLLPDSPFPPGWVDLRDPLNHPALAQKLAARLSHLLPARMTARLLGLCRPSLDEEAAAYACAATGTLVSLSHRNVLAAVHQMDSTLVLLPGDRVFLDDTFTSLPALVFGLWVPCLKQNAALFRTLGARQTDPVLLFEEHPPDAVLLSPDLTREIAASQRPLPGAIRIFLDFSPSAPDPAEIARLESAGAAHCLGYAPPGLGAIVSMNTADPNSMIPHHLPQTGNVPGTVGRLLPGLSARLLSPGGKPLPPGEKGILALRGISIPGLPHLSLDGLAHHRLEAMGQFDRQGFLTLDPPSLA